MNWQLLRRKDVMDWDGFWTEYSLYKSEDGSKYVCVFGDSEIYTPENGDWDFETEFATEAIEWFENYDTDWYDEDAEEDLFQNPETVDGWIQQDVIDMYRRER